MINVKIEIEKMKLGEQEEFELLSGCSLQDLAKKGLSGRRLAALIFIFARREDKSVTFEQCLDLDMEQATNMIADGPDPKGSNS
jgi:hypothetical protein